MIGTAKGEILMKKQLLLFPRFTVLGLTECHGIGENAASLSIIYGAVAFLALLLLIGCHIVVRKNRRWFIILFSSVLVVNTGYTFLSMSTNLKMALSANRIAYLGSVFLPLSMLMIILKVTNTKCRKWLSASLFILAVVVFLIAASPGILPIYYKEVSFKIVDGVSTLVKVYGPLHPLYLLYLLGYFAAMVTVIIRASVKKTIESATHAIILAIAVFVNIGVWFIEQLSDIDFEFLSVSYIISELFLLGVHLVIKENQRLRELVLQKEETLRATRDLEKNQRNVSVSAEAMEDFAKGVETLTPTERAIFEAYLLGMSTKDIMADMNIKENTLKFHNKNIYGKLGVSSRKQLIEVHRAMKET